MGQTGRSFGTRYKAHEQALKRLNKYNTSNFVSTWAFGEHLHGTNHSASPNNPIPLHLELKGQRLDLLESSEIKIAIRNNKHILSNQLDIKKHLIIDMYSSSCAISENGLRLLSTYTCAECVF